VLLSLIEQTKVEVKIELWVSLDDGRVIKPLFSTRGDRVKFDLVQMDLLTIIFHQGLKIAISVQLL